MSLSFVLYFAHLVFSSLGILVISYGVARAVLLFLINVFFKRKAACTFYHARLVLCENIIFGMDFMIASGVTRIVSLDYMNMVLLGGLIIIRITFSYFLKVDLVRLVETHKFVTKCLTKQY